MTPQWITQVWISSVNIYVKKMSSSSCEEIPSAVSDVEFVETKTEKAAVRKRHTEKSKKLAGYVERFGGNQVFCIIDSKTFFCKTCNCKVSAKEMFHVKQHVERKKHQTAVERVNQGSKN